MKGNGVGLGAGSGASHVFQASRSTGNRRAMAVPARVTVQA
jgi:hypothetical protein